jgi:hypothetical protein
MGFNWPDYNQEREKVQGKRVGKRNMNSGKHIGCFFIDIRGKYSVTSFSRVKAKKAIFL